MCDRRAGDGGFTLVELLVVCAVIGILAAITMPMFLDQRRRAWTAELSSAAVNVALEVEAAAAATAGRYGGSNGAFPDEAAFDGFVTAALDELQGGATDGATYDPADGTAQVASFRICFEHALLVDGLGDPEESVVYESSGGGVQDPAGASC